MSKLAEKKAKQLEALHQRIRDVIAAKNFTLSDELDEVKSTHDAFNYVCACGTAKRQTLKDLNRGKQCRGCKSLLFLSVPEDSSVLNDIQFLENEIWKAVQGGFVSNFGRAANVMGKLLVADEKDRYHMAGKHQYRKILVAKAFEIDNHETLHGQVSNGVVSVVSSDESLPLADRVKVTTRNEVGAKNGKKSRQSENFTSTLHNSVIEHARKYKSVTTAELPNHTIFEDGSVYNTEIKTGGNRFLCFSNSSHQNEKQYKKFASAKKNYYVHRLVCMAFNPLEGKTKYDDYKGIEVNHKNGNTFDNNAANLEWVTHSENMNHAYQSNLNKKKRRVQQLTLAGLLIQEYPSIAEAARDLDIPEHRIREVAKGKSKPSTYIWRYADGDDKEWSKKYSHSN
jgi:hypothetical protein